MAEPHALHDTLHDLLRAAGQTAQQFRTSLSIDRKADGSVVTDADRACEDVLSNRLRTDFPGVGIVGEEGAHRTGTDGVWYIDPIDGTESFTRGLTVWGPTVCWVRDGQPQVGALYLPDSGDFFFAAAGHGCWHNGRRIVRQQLVGRARSWSACVPSRIHLLPGGFPWPGKVRNLGSTAAHLAYAATGGVELAIISGSPPWDVAAGILLVRESGGVIQTLDNSPLTLDHEEQGLPFLAGASIAVRTLHEYWAASPQGS